MEHRDFPESTTTAEARRTTHAGAAFHFRINFCRQGVALRGPFRFVTAPSPAYLEAMPSKPRKVAQSFVRDIRAFFAAPGTLKQDEIAARQCWRSTMSVGRGGKKLRLADVKPMFVQLRSGMTVRTVAWKVRK